MSAITALFLGAASTLPATDLPPNDLPSLFENACLNGEAKLAPGSVTSVDFAALPAELRRSLGNPSSAQVWRLNGAGRAFLYILGYPPSRDSSPRICGLASDQMDYSSAADAVEMRVTGTVHPRTTRSTQWLNLDGGYDALATVAGDFKVLQINWLSDSQRDALIKIRPAIP